MKITVAESLRPFSHALGASCLIPFSAWKLVAFPTRLQLENIRTGERIDLRVSLTGPVKEFTVQQDLEVGFVKVFGFAAKGYFRYRLEQQDEGLFLSFERAPSSGVTISFSGSSQQVNGPAKVLLSDLKEKSIGKPFERLSLGQNKSQDWCGVRKRANLAEIFPHWLRLGQVVPEISSKEQSEGIFELLKTCKEASSRCDKREIAKPFANLFLAGFSGLMTPRLVDEEHQGIVSDICSASPSSALKLLSEGAHAIRSLFFQEREDVYHLLPCLPSEFHSGRFLSITTTQGDSIDLEWSKKLLHRVIIRVNADKEIALSLQKDLKRFRMKKALKQRGTILEAGVKILCTKGDVLYLDNFQK